MHSYSEQDKTLHIEVFRRRIVFYSFIHIFLKFTMKFSYKMMSSFWNASLNMSLINLKLASSLHTRTHRNHDTSAGKEHKDHFVFWPLISLMRKLRLRESDWFGQGHTTSELNIVKIFQLSVLKAANTGALVNESLKILLKSFCQQLFFFLPSNDNYWSFWWVHGNTFYYSI